MLHSPDVEADTAPRATPIDIRQAYGVSAAPAPREAAPASPWEEEPQARVAEDSTDHANVVLPAPLPHDADDAGIPTSTVVELLLRARNIYARRFWLFFPLGALPQVPLIISPLDVEDPSVAGIFSLVFSLLLFVAATAATILAVANLHVDGRVHFSRCIADASQVALPMLLVQLIIGFSLVASVILMAVLIGFPLFLYFLATLFFAPHAVAIERLNPLFALGRSRQLVRGHIVRVIVVGVLFIVVAALIHLAFIVPAMLLSPEDAMTLNVAWAAAASFATPLITIGGTLMYFDLRARSEGYGLGQLKSELERD